MRLGPAEVRFTGRAEGDLGHRDGTVTADVEQRRRRILDRPWTWLRQVHGSEVAVVDRPGDCAGHEADAAVSGHPGAALAVFVADCAPVALASPEGVIGAVHAGWRGLAAGVIENAVRAMAGLGATRIEAALGPCIHAGCYEFSPHDLDEVAARLGDAVRGRTADGRAALDVPAAVRRALAGAGVSLRADHGGCTACSPDHFSHRARREPERQAMVVWIP